MKDAKTMYEDIRSAGINRLLAELSDEAKPVSSVFRHQQWPAEYWIEQARLDGHLIIETNKGYLIAPDFESFNQWRKQYVLSLIHI